MEFKYSPQENKYDQGDGFPVSITFDDVISGKKDNIHFDLDPANCELAVSCSQNKVSLNHEKANVI